MSAFTFEEICSRHDVWLHMEGHALAGLVLLETESTKEDKVVNNTDEVKVHKHKVPVGDSLSLTIGSWLGIPALPFVTLYKVGFRYQCVTLSAIK